MKYIIIICDYTDYSLHRRVHGGCRVCTCTPCDFRWQELRYSLVYLGSLWLRPITGSLDLTFKILDIHKYITTLFRLDIIIYLISDSIKIKSGSNALVRTNNCTIP